MLPSGGWADDSLLRGAGGDEVGDVYHDDESLPTHAAIDRPHMAVDFGAPPPAGHSSVAGFIAVDRDLSLQGFVHPWDGGPLWREVKT
jgi:hypothetical protein